MPWCFGASGFVRANSMPRSHHCAAEFHTFCPETMKSSPSRTARHPRLARSEPAPGSLKSWHHASSPESKRGTSSRCCSSVPKAMSVGPSIVIVERMNPDDASYSAASSS